MAEFRERYEEIRGTNGEVAGISVDDPGHSEPLRGLYQLPFALLCDPTAEVIRAWGLYNEKEKGGIAQSAVFVIQPGLKVRFASLDTTVSRVRADGVLDYLRAVAAGQAEPAPPQRRLVVPNTGELIRTVVPSIKLSFFPPKRLER